MKSIIELNTWNRKEHFEFFNGFDEPFFGIVTEVECSQAIAWCRQKDIPFFHFYLYQSLKAANQVEEFRFRIEEEKPVCYDVIHASSTISRPDGTFGFSYIPFSDNFQDFSLIVKKETNAVAKTQGLRLNENTKRNDVIHFSVLPWIKFTSLTHARHFAYRDSVPKITFGRYYEENGRILMPVSVNAHHGLMDAWHVAKFLELFTGYLSVPGYSV